MGSVWIVGAGVIGQATGKGFIASRHGVWFTDINPEATARLRQDGYRVAEPEGPPNPCDATFICVNTPTIEGRIDLSAVRGASIAVGRALRAARPFHVVVLRSTVPPGTMRDVVVPILREESGKQPGSDFLVAYNPEFLREASAIEDVLNPWVVVFGCSDMRARSKVHSLYEPILHDARPPVIDTDIETAEMIKYASNLFNATKISFSNEIWATCQALGLAGDEVMQAASLAAEGMWNARYGIRGGFAYGGACLPKDTVAFLEYARERGLDMPLLESVIEVNKRIAALGQQPEHPRQVDRAA